MKRAVSLFSGSLASVVATKLIMEEEGIEEIKLLHFRSPFFRDYERSKEIAKGLWDISFRSQSVKKDFKEAANIPGNGSYKLKNSCIGCRKLMLRKGARYMKKVGADFLITGEILGKHELGSSDMEEITKRAGVKGLVLRPLSAKLLAETLPEREGWVKRENMKRLRAEDVDGLRSLAKELRIEVEGFPTEERCKLTQPDFGQRLEDLLQEKNFTMNALELLEFPLYYKKPPDIKIVLGRDDEEKRRLQNFFLPEDLRLYVPIHEGPMALVRTNWGEKSAEDIESIIELAARITATHSKAKNTKVRANYRFENKSETFRINVLPLPVRELEKYYLR